MILVKSTDHQTLMILGATNRDTKSLNIGFKNHPDIYRKRPKNSCIFDVEEFHYGFDFHFKKCLNHRDRRRRSWQPAYKNSYFRHASESVRNFSPDAQPNIERHLIDSWQHYPTFQKKIAGSLQVPVITHETRDWLDNYFPPTTSVWKCSPDSTCHPGLPHE